MYELTRNIQENVSQLQQNILDKQSESITEPKAMSATMKKRIYMFFPLIVSMSVSVAYFVLWY